MSRPVALIDLDGTLADFDKAMRRELAALNDPSLHPEDYLEHDAEEKYPYIAAQRALIKAKPGFWRDLDDLPLGIGIAFALREVGFRLHVATRASKKYPQCWAEKIEWCVDGDKPGAALHGVGITITTDKTLLRGAVLVDDWPGYFKPWAELNPGGCVIIPAQPWNEGHGVPYEPGDNLRLRQPIIRVTEATDLSALADALFELARIKSAGARSL